MTINRHFIDTSALFKRYVLKKGTNKIDNVFMQKGTIFIADLTIIEVVSNLKRKNEISSELNREVYDKIKSEFFKNISDGIIKISETTSSTIIKAVSLIDKTYVTPIDSLQLASALELKNDYNNIVFVCSDKKLNSLAKNLGLKTTII